MEFLKEFVNFVLHIDRHLLQLATEYHFWIYLIVGLIVFTETAFVVTPFLPGDSLLFAAGTLAGSGALSLWILIPIILVAAIGGDNINFNIGRHLGHRIVLKNYRWLNRNHIHKAHLFYERHGGKALVVARFMPILRSMVPFVAGMSDMDYRRFVGYCIVGNHIWTFSFTCAGFLLGQNEWIQRNFSFLILGITVVSMLPPTAIWIYHQIKSHNP